MAWHAPCLKDLCALNKHYLVFYPDNPEYTVDAARFSMVVLYDYLVKHMDIENNPDPEKAQAILMGCEVFKLVSIKYGKDEYHGSSPKKGKYLGSTFYTFSKQKLNITKQNPLGYDQRQIYLHAFKDFVEQHVTDEDLQQLAEHNLLRKHHVSLVWNNKKQLQDEIDKAMKNILEKNNVNLNCIINSVPVLDELQKSMEEIGDEHKEASSNPENPERLRQKNYIAFINHSVRDYETAHAWDISLATIANLLLEIDKEYARTNVWPIYWGPDHSAMYRKGAKTLNKKLSDIPLDVKVYWFDVLNQHLIVLLAAENKDKYEKLLDTVITKNDLQKKIKRAQLDEEMRRFKNDIQARWESFKEESTKQTWLGYGVEKATTYAVQLGMTSLAFQATRAAVTNLGTIGFFSRTALNSGLAMFGPTGVLLISGLSYLVAAKTLENGTAKVFALLLGKIGSTIASKIGKAAASAVNYHFSPTPEGLHELRKNLTAEEDKVFVDWINSLLTLDQVAKDDKQLIRKVLHLGENEKLLPLVIKTEEEREIEREMIVQGYACKVL